MTTKEMIRCKHCAYLVEGEDGSWVCDDYEIDIHKIPDEACALEQEY